MSDDAQQPQSKLEIPSLLARWILGGIFIFTGLSKALHPVEFLKLVREYELTQNHVLLNSIAALLPWFEVFCGLLLVLGIAVRGTALTLTLLLGLFTGAVLHRALAIHSAQQIAFCAVKFDCGCGTGEVFACHKLLENLVLILLSVWLLFGFGKKMCVRYNLL